MGLFSKLFGYKKNDKYSKVTKPTFEIYEKLIDIIVVSETLQSELKIKIKEAFDNPKSFYNDTNGFILSERGLTFPKDTLLTPKFVLLDILQDNDQMIEVDWKEDEEEIRFALNKIIKAKNYNFTLGNNSIYDNNDTFEIIKLIDKKELNPFGFSLEILDIDSDSYVFTVIQSPMTFK